MIGGEERDRVNRRTFVGIVSGAAAGTLLSDASMAVATLQPQWQPDGASATQLGLLTPDFDVTPESEVAAMNRARVPVFASRMPIKFTREVLTDPTHADSALALLSALNLGAILYASTSTAYFLGPEGENAFIGRMQARARNIPFISPAAALAQALRALNVRRIALVHPPWFGEETHELGRAYFSGRGFDVVSSGRITPARRYSEVPAEEVYRWIAANTPKEAEAVVQGGNGLRIIGTITPLERALGRAVVTANQAMFWRGLRAARSQTVIKGYGRLFEARG
jgi:maleate isomerase